MFRVGPASQDNSILAVIASNSQETGSELSPGPHQFCVVPHLKKKPEVLREKAWAADGTVDEVGTMVTNLDLTTGKRRRRRRITGR